MDIHHQTVQCSAKKVDEAPTSSIAGRRTPDIINTDRHRQSFIHLLLYWPLHRSNTPDEYQIMRPSTSLGAMPSIWQRTLDHMRRQTRAAVRLEGLRTPEHPYPLIRFDNAEKLDYCKVMSDAGQGGFSKASMTFERGDIPHTDLTKPSSSIQGETNTALSKSASSAPPHVLFKGSISTQLPVNQSEVQRSGFAGLRTRDQGYSLFGRVLWDLGAYAYVALRVKSDGRKYFVNVQTDSIVPTDLHQHILPTLTPGQWETVTIPFSSFVRTNHGIVVEPQGEMPLIRVRSVGISLLDRVQGPFELRIAEIYATNTSGRQLNRRDSGFTLTEESIEDDEHEEPSRRKPTEPEKILI